MQGDTPPPRSYEVPPRLLDDPRVRLPNPYTFFKTAFWRWVTKERDVYDVTGRKKAFVEAKLRKQVCGSMTSMVPGRNLYWDGLLWSNAHLAITADLKRNYSEFTLSETPEGRCKVFAELDLKGFSNFEHLYKYVQIVHFAIQQFFPAGTSCVLSECEPKSKGSCPCPDIRKKARLAACNCPESVCQCKEDDGLGCTGLCPECEGNQHCDGKCAAAIGAHLVFDKVVRINELRTILAFASQSLEKAGLDPTVLDDAVCRRNTTTLRINGAVKAITCPSCMGETFSGYDCPTCENKRNVLHHVPYWATYEISALGVWTTVGRFKPSFIAVDDDVVNDPIRLPAGVTLVEPDETRSTNGVHLHPQKDRHIILYLRKQLHSLFPQYTKTKMINCTFVSDGAGTVMFYRYSLDGCGAKYCPNAGREHRSNKSHVTVSRSRVKVYCFSKKCQGQGGVVKPLTETCKLFTMKPFVLHIKQKQHARKRTAREKPFVRTKRPCPGPPVLKGLAKKVKVNYF